MRISYSRSWKRTIWPREGASDVGDLGSPEATFLARLELLRKHVLIEHTGVRWLDLS